MSIYKNPKFGLILISLLMIVGLVFWLIPSTMVFADEWDKSALLFTSGAEGDCEEITATLCNADDAQDMAGTSTWELYWIASGNPKSGIVITSGTISQLNVGECQVLTYDPNDNPNGPSGNYMFKLYQRPGHPGTGVAWSESKELVCSDGKVTEPESEPEPLPVRAHPMTCYQVWINEDNNFEFVFWWVYGNNNWVQVFDMEGNLVWETDFPKDEPQFEVDLPDGMYKVQTFHEAGKILQEFYIGKPGPEM